MIDLRKERIRKLKARIKEITLKLQEPISAPLSVALSKEHNELSHELKVVRMNVHSSSFFEWNPNRLPNRRQKREMLRNRN
jgi:hypothetical protein